MNMQTMLLSGSDPGKLRSHSISQLTACEVILTAALEGSIQRMQSYTGNSPNFLSNNCNGIFPSPQLDPNRTGSSLRDLLTPLFFQRNSVRFPQAYGVSTNVVRSPSQGYQQESPKIDWEKVQTIRNQALALTQDSPFGLFQGNDGALGTYRSGGIEVPRSGGIEVPRQISNTASTGAEVNQDGVLKALGSAMRKKNSMYIDTSSMSDPDPTDLARRRTRGGVTEPFPDKLHRMLVEVEETGKSDIISFFSHGRAFGVHDPERFVKEIMPTYFKQSRLSSFQRQLNLYGFTRISSGPDVGGYYHELFLRGRPALCIHMRRVGVPQGEDRRKLKSGIKKTEPNFYAMKPVKD